MKNLVITVVTLMLFCACKDETSKKTTPNDSSETKTEKSSAKILNLECATFFKKGDYSSLCFTDSKSPEYISRGCIFDFVTKGDKQEQSIQVQFDSKGSSALAEMSFNLYKNNYKKGKVTEVGSVGDAAFFDVHGTDLKSMSRSNKDLYVQYNNITFILMAEYKSNTEMPCFYTDKDLVLFAEKIIKNL